MTSVKRTELQMFDGRQIFYYDRNTIGRTAVDSRPYSFPSARAGDEKLAET